MRKAIIFDIDGVLIHSLRMEKQAEKLGVDYFEYFKSHIEDISNKDYNQEMIELYQSFCKNHNYHVFVLTARSEEIRHETEEQLYLFSLWQPYKIYMRKQDDFRPAWQVKKDYLKQIQKEYEVVLAIDDEDDNIRMYRNNQVKNVLKVYNVRNSR